MKAENNVPSSKLSILKQCFVFYLVLGAWEFGNIGKQNMSRTLEPGSIVPQPILRTYGLENSKTNTYTYANAANYTRGAFSFVD